MSNALLKSSVIMTTYGFVRSSSLMMCNICNTNMRTAVVEPPGLEAN